MLKRGKRGKKSNGEIYKKIYDAICATPGLTYTGVANVLKVGRQTVYMALTLMDKRGFMLCEDDAGRLYPYKE